MGARIAAALLTLVSAAASGAAGSAGIAQGSPARPNVLVVMTDDQRADELGPMPIVRRELAAEGVSFANAYATFPLCCPSRATLLTGQYAHNHGVMGNELAEGGGYHAFDDTGSLPVALQTAGYRTGMFGKYLNEYDVLDVPDGWDRWAALTGRYALYDYTLNVDGHRRHFGSSPRDYQTNVVGRMGSRFIEQSAGDQPFFLWASFFAPHGESLPGDERWNPRPAPGDGRRYRDAPLPRPPSFDERDVSDKPAFAAGAKRISRARVDDLRWRHRSRLAALHSVDHEVGRLLDALRDAGELENTLVIFISDNAFLMGEHRLESKQWLYEESARVPLIMAGPGVPAGAVREQIVGNIDLAPTIFDVTGVAPMRAPDGMSLLPLASNPAVEADRDILLENAKSNAIRTPGWMYAQHHTKRGLERELYDLEADPYELRSLHADPAHAAVRAELAARLDELRDCAGAGCR